MPGKHSVTAVGEAYVGYTGGNYIKRKQMNVGEKRTCKRRKRDERRKSKDTKRVNVNKRRRQELDGNESENRGRNVRELKSVGEEVDEG